MTGGVVDFIEGLGKKGLTFLEEEVESIEGVGDKKGVYPSTFKGEVLEKHDPYDEDDGDHAAHGAETEVPEAKQDAQWFPAVKKAGTTKVAAVAAPGTGSPVANPKDGDKGQDGSASGQVATGSDATSDSNNPSAANSTVDPLSGTKNTAGAGAGSPKGAASGDGAGSRPTATDQAADSNADAKVARRNNGASSTAASGSKDPLTATDDTDAAAGNADAANSAASLEDDGALTSKRSPPAGGGSSVPASRKGASATQAADNSPDPNADDAGAEDDSASDASRSDSEARKSQRTNANKRNDVKDPENAEDGTASDDASKDTDADADAEEESPSHDSASTVFDRKAPSLIADLDDLASKGKKAKAKKETIRGARRTLEEPHKLFKDPERLQAARSGDPETIKHSLKRHGRAIVPIDDADPQDISADPTKLEAVRSNPNKAIRAMIDMGQQYGKDPFEGVDPADVQAIIEHHAAEHPHRKHKVPYVPPAASDDDSEDSEDDANVEGADAHTDAIKTRSNKRKKTKQDDEADAEPDDFSGEDDANANNDSGDAGSESDEDEAPSYPKLDEAADLDPDDPDNDPTPPRKRNKKKRSYPKPYVNNDDPSDLQLACDSLSTMASGGNGSADSQDDDDEVSDDAPLHKKKAHAAKKVLKGLNRVRSFQQNPEACEGAFVDEAADEGAEVAGLSPDDVEDHYYALKAVSVSYKALSDPQADDDADDTPTKQQDADDAADEDDSEYMADDDSSEESNAEDSDDEGHDDGDSDNDDDDPPSHAKKKSHKKSKHAAHARQDDTYADSGNSSGYSSNVIINQGDAYTNTATPDIEMSLPSNQFPNTVVYATDPNDPSLNVDPTQDAQTDPSAGGGSDDPMSQMMGMAMGLLGGSGDGSDPTTQVTGMLTGLLSNPAEATALEEEATGLVSGLSGAEKTAESMEGAVGKLSKTEKELAKVEAAGSKAASASSKIGKLKGEKAKYAQMINLCSDPRDEVAEAENALSTVNELAQHPDAVINQADALINVAQQGIGALASAKSPEDAMAAMMGMAAQLSGGDGEDGSGAASPDDGSGAAIDPNTGLAIDPATGLEFDPTTGLAYDPATGTMIDPTTGAPVNPNNAQSQQGNANAQAVPAEFANAGMYGDE
jgi:hypothetical protein